MTTSTHHYPIVEIEYDPLSALMSGKEEEVDEEEEESMIRKRSLSHEQDNECLIDDLFTDVPSMAVVPAGTDELEINLEPDTRNIFPEECHLSFDSDEAYKAFRLSQAEAFHQRASWIVKELQANLLELGWMIERADKLKLHTYLNRTSMKAWLREIGISPDIRNYAQMLAKIWPYYRDLGLTLADLLCEDMSPIKAQFILGKKRDAERQIARIEHDLKVQFQQKSLLQEQQATDDFYTEEESEEEEDGPFDDFSEDEDKDFPSLRIVESNNSPSLPSLNGKYDPPPPSLAPEQVETVPIIDTITPDVQQRISQEAYQQYVAQARADIAYIVHGSSEEDLLDDARIKHGQRQKPRLVIELSRRGEEKYTLVQREQALTYDDLLDLQKGKIELLFAISGEDSLLTMKEMATHFLDLEDNR